MTSAISLSAPFFCFTNAARLFIRSMSLIPLARLLDSRLRGNDGASLPYHTNPSRRAAFPPSTASAAGAPSASRACAMTRDARSIG